MRMIGKELTDVQKWVSLHQLEYAEIESLKSTLLNAEKALKKIEEYRQGDSKHCECDSNRLTDPCEHEIAIRGLAEIRRVTKA